MFKDIKKFFSDFISNLRQKRAFRYAPLIAIPSYQEEPARSFEEMDHPEVSYTSYNYEMIANKLPRQVLIHPESTTDAILKTELVSREGDFDTVGVKAFSYVGVPRLELVPMLGNDGRLHSVPVHWTEYIPREKYTLMRVRNVRLTQSEYNNRISAFSAEKLPKNSACFGGIFAYIDDGFDNINEFINNITQKGEK